MSAHLPMFPVVGPRVVYTDSADACNNEIAKLLPITVLGFDQEWKPIKEPGDNHPISVIQVATGQVAIVHQMGRSAVLPSLLIFVLEDPTVIKVGVGIRDDVKRLARDWQVQLCGYLCLTELAMIMEPHCWQKTIPAPNRARITATGNKRRPSKRAPDDLTRADPPGLKRLVAHFLAQSLDKPHNIRCSDWSLPLQETQICYAAYDAFAGHSIFVRMAEQADPADLTALINID